VQSPGMATSRGGTQPRALNANRSSRQGWGSSDSNGSSDFPALPPRPKAEWANTITNKVRDNGDLELVAGDRIRHSDFGEGRVNQVTGEGTKRVAHVMFEKAGAKKLLIKIAPIEKI